MVYGRTKDGYPIRAPGITVLVPGRGATDRRYWKGCGERDTQINGWLLVAPLFSFAFWGKI